MADDEEGEIVQRSVECDICGVEYDIPDGEVFANCTGTDCGERILLPRLEYGLSYIRLVCCGFVAYDVCTIDDQEYDCRKCGNTSRIINTVAELRCKQLVYETEMLEPYPGRILSLMETIRNLNNELGRSDVLKLENDKLRLDLRVAKDEIEDLKYKRRNPEWRSDKAHSSDAKQSRLGDIPSWCRYYDEK